VNTAVRRRPLYSAQRRQAILQALTGAGRVDAGELAVRLAVTGETVRKDLIALEGQGLLRRVHGGAIPVDEPSFEPEVGDRREFAAEKRRIAEVALTQLPRRGAVLIDAGSTTAMLAELMPTDRELTVYTNTLPIALTLARRSNLTVYTLGGRLRRQTLAEVDGWASRALSEINVDVAFLGANGVSISRGLTTPDPAEAHVKRLMLGTARRRVLLADHSKLGQVHTCRYGELSDVEALVTDSGMDDEQAAALRSAGVQVQIA
jgi:DeoR family transcriptional regulator, fructose operon transcriptional repressor